MTATLKPARKIVPFSQDPDVAKNGRLLAEKRAALKTARDALEEMKKNRHTDPYNLEDRQREIHRLDKEIAVCEGEEKKLHTDKSKAIGEFFQQRAGEIRAQAVANCKERLTLITAWEALEREIRHFGYDSTLALEGANVRNFLKRTTIPGGTDDSFLLAAKNAR